MKKIIKLLDKNKKLRATPVQRQTIPVTLAKLEQIETKVDKTFQLWPANAQKLIKDPEELQFLQSVKTDREATFGSSDMVLAK